MDYPTQITIDNQLFALFKKRRDQTIAVYKSKNAFLRTGKKTAVEREIIIGDKLAAFNFPIAKRITTGTHEGRLYCIEKSLGEKHFSSLFADDITNYGHISDRLFKQFITLTKKYTEAQLKTTIKTKGYKDFTSGIHIKYVIKERPDLKEKILKVYTEAKKHLSVYPFVLTHGDFNPHNLYPKGFIDFEDLFYAPAGYDIVTNIFHIEYFPKTKNYEFYGKYQFTKKQKLDYLQIFDQLYEKHNLLPLSKNIKFFEFCRAVWLVARMQKYPKIHDWRYNLFTKQFLKHF